MSAPLGPEQRIIHYLNRIGCGPTPKEVQKVTRAGIRAYQNEHLLADALADGAIEEKVADLKTMRMNSRELFELYPPVNIAKERGMAMAGAMNAPRLIILELQQARLLRAVQSQRQLYELMVD